MVFTWPYYARNERVLSPGGKGSCTAEQNACQVPMMLTLFEEPKIKNILELISSEVWRCVPVINPS